MTTAPASHSLIRRLVEDSRSAFGMALVSILVLAAVFGPVLSSYAPDAADFMATLAPPSADHFLGTDDLGRDVLSRILSGARVSLLVGVISVGGAVLVGLPIGLVAGYLGGRTDAVLMRCMDVLLAFPGILLALGITAALGASLTNTIIAIAVINTPTIARVTRAQTMLVSSLDYVKANRALGFSNLTIMTRSVLPNALSPVLVQASLLLASSIITESYLSFLGLGVQPPTPTWGSMLRDAISFIDQATWLAWFPGAAIFLTVLGFNIFGDGLRDRLDPRD
ncbi:MULTISPECIES: ABC transporter permease [Rhizobium/Agrobacterium group]|jgi:peptide/nickel transport system permease protein|uniref:Peptide/nickel transport system permease protein n=1 Tax=Rhizobium soli TaxID=424798 RepID=A0A7X0MTA6_9HYPH|nr:MULTISPECIES: ABC transporter permease [Rhizobium/Agrobacterium group]MBB6510827.1 peptide/nickel transport system permease protein [Rhizobium soli]NSY19892.1 ABC transporter permease [Neorhizobium sp. AL 9.2.2]